MARILDAYRGPGFFISLAAESEGEDSFGVPSVVELNPTTAASGAPHLRPCPSSFAPRRCPSHLDASRKRGSGSATCEPHGNAGKRTDLQAREPASRGRSKTDMLNSRSAPISWAVKRGDPSYPTILFTGTGANFRPGSAHDGVDSDAIDLEVRRQGVRRHAGASTPPGNALSDGHGKRVNQRPVKRTRS
jgi:hypothetical protein